MVDRFHDQVLAQGKIGGEARAMVVTNGIERAIQYFHAIRDYLKERKKPVPGHPGPFHAGRTSIHVGGRP